MMGSYLLNILDLFWLFSKFAQIAISSKGQIVISIWLIMYLMLLFMALSAGNFTISEVSPSKMLELCLRSYVVCENLLILEL